MLAKKKRRVSLASQGLAPGEDLKRSALPSGGSFSWNWVGTSVTSPADITDEHRMATCGLSKSSHFPFCPNKYSLQFRKGPQEPFLKRAAEDVEHQNDIITISDDEESKCTPKVCRSNPNCLNYLGQDDWENESNAMRNFLKTMNLGDNPILTLREPGYPVGLKNLGSTCYANASLQVWFRDSKFRNGVYTCQPLPEGEAKFEESPIFQLQVTFAALQESVQSVFNPVKLVESLQLRATEQQDAQEFSKLFMSHLDAEFKKQAVPAVKCLITDQFQGQQLYGTICNHCHYRSERISDFLEIEISLTSNSSLEDRISALLEPELLSGDNQYLCSQCDSLRDATRYTELRELPPVLHFSLLRFVYDVSTMERKKSKHAVSFPISLDMSKFLGSTDQATYELRGILLHKGSSAYHGHYEAQVYDDGTQSWFQFNDEIVTKIDSLSEPKFKLATVDAKREREQSIRHSQMRKSRVNDRKRRRVDDSDGETAQAIQTKSTLSKSRTISSKDAYMLIYSRKELSAPLVLKNNQTSITGLVPPRRALKVINLLNAAHDEACDTFNIKENIAKSQFQQRRREVMEIYRTWNVRSVEEPSVVVSQHALKRWLSGRSNETVSTENTGQILQAVGGVSPQMHILQDDIICSHRHLDPSKAGNIKRICERAYTQIIRDTGYTLQPNLAVDVCDTCVKHGFKERLYQIEHPRLVSEFDRASKVVSDSEEFWISKCWLKDWRLTRPKMHVASEIDPGPDSPEFEAHVKCEHQGLSPYIVNRRKISVDGMKLLQKLYPLWDPISTNTEVCPVCDATSHISKEDRRGLRKTALNERNQLEHMMTPLEHLYNLASVGNVAISELLENGHYAIVPANFLKMWLQWLKRPTEAPRPNTIDNTTFICEHDLLNFDPNSIDFNSSFSVVKRADWNTLEKLYPGGPLISVERRWKEGSVQSTFIHDTAICVDCQLKRISNWTTAEITVRLCDSKATSTKTKGLSISTKKVGARQSKRLRQAKGLGERHQLTIAKSMTVKEIKIMLQEELNIPTIYQRLSHQGKELDDNTATVATLQINPNDVLDLEEQNEVIEIDSGTEERTPRDEGRGFGGTLLGSSPGQVQESTDCGVGKSCSTCTFFNESAASSCTICDTALI